MDKQLDELLNEYDTEDLSGILHLFDNPEEGVMIVNKDYQIIHYSDNLGKIESLSAADVLGKNLFDVFPIGANQDSTIYMCLNEGKKIVDKILEYRTFKGTSVKVINSTLPLYKDGQIIAALDISKNLYNMGKIDKLLTTQKGSQAGLSGKCSFAQIRTVSPKMKKAINYGERAAMQEAPVLLVGETGTGKELFTQCIHHNGVRRDGPFVALNCAAIPSELTESMLFGTEHGGFTGAVDRMGLFEQAHGGTLMLDEINSMSISLQAKLLRVLQEGTFRRIGGKQDITSDVRIITTTNQDLMEAIEHGAFRRDLFYRISVISIEIPPLRDRQGDIEYLAEYYVEHFCHKLGRPVSVLQQEVRELFLAYSWPGNIRELRNIIEGVLCLIPEEADISVEDLPSYMRTPPATLVAAPAREAQEGTLQEQLARQERRIIIRAISQYRSIAQAASHLGLSRQSLQYRMKRLGISKEDFILEYRE